MLMPYLWRGEIFHSNNWLNAMVKNCKAIFSFIKHGLISKDCFIILFFSFFHFFLLFVSGAFLFFYFFKKLFTILNHN